MPRYGTTNDAYLASWLERPEPGGPMWALNLMKYRPVAEYLDGRDTTLTGEQADDLYAPVGPLGAVGAKIVLVAPVTHQLIGDETVWDRIAIAQYPYRAALMEMNMRDDFQEAHVHKDAGMDFTIVLATFPAEGAPVPAQISGADTDHLLLLQVVADADAPDLADGIDSTRIGRFAVEDRIIGDNRTFAETRFDLISPATAAELAAREPIADPTGYAVIADPLLDEVARSLTERSRVLLSETT